MPRYVILEHDFPALHWDFLLEAGPVLRAWRLAEAPGPGRSVPAEASFDHRLLYLDYEGSVSGGRGSVRRWDAGTYRSQEDGGGLILWLDGGRLRGPARLAPDGAGGRWTFSAGPLTEPGPPPPGPP